MNKFSKIAAVAALIGVSASASAWWGPGSSTTSFMDEFFGDGAGDFNMNMNTSTRGWGRGYGRGYDYYGYGPYGYGAPYGYPAPYGVALTTPVAPVQAPVAQ